MSILSAHAQNPLLLSDDTMRMRVLPTWEDGVRSLTCVSEFSSLTWLSPPSSLSSTPPHRLLVIANRLLQEALVSNV